MKIKMPIAMLMLLVVLLSCTHDPVIPETPQVSFSTQVGPIFISNCATVKCHDGSAEFDLSSYETVRKHVKPGDARGSSAYRAITTLWGESAMPPNGPLSQQQINLIYVWIMQGAKDN